MVRSDREGRGAREHLTRTVMSRGPPRSTVSVTLPCFSSTEYVALLKENTGVAACASVCSVATLALRPALRAGPSGCTCEREAQWVI